jgi:hypothetical protein
MRASVIRLPPTVRLNRRSVPATKPAFFKEHLELVDVDRVRRDLVRVKFLRLGRPSGQGLGRDRLDRWDPSARATGVPSRRRRQTLSFDEYAIASFLAGSEETWPVYLFAQLRVPSLLPQLIAVSSVVFIASMLLILSAEIGRRIAQRRYGREFTAQGLISSR